MSVVLNGKVIVANQGLSTNAIRVVIHITPDLGDSLQLTMYAENLGSIPPNTSYLVAIVGKKQYEARLFADEGTSALVRFIKPKTKE